MENNIQIVMFFSKNVSYNPTKIAAKINELIPLLGQPLILPPAKEDNGQPLIIFNQNNTFQLTTNLGSVSFIFLSEHLKEYKKIVLQVLDIFDKEDIGFSRIGYVASNALSKKDIAKFKKRIFKDEELLEAEDFQLAWYKSIILDGTKVNCWERYFTDHDQSDKLVSIFDINTPLNEEYNVSEDFVDRYISNCNKFIEDKLK